MFLLLALTPFSGAISVQALSSSVETSLSFTNRDVIVRFRDGSSAARAPSATELQLLEEDGAYDNCESLGEPGLFSVQVRNGFDPVGVAAELSLDLGVEYAQPDQTIHLDDPSARYESSTSIDAPPGNSWALDAIHAPDAWRFGMGQGVTVAVLDTGVSASHPDLVGRVLPGWNFVKNDSDASDNSGHGTFVAGLIAASSSRGPIGVAPDATILPVKILNSAGVGSTAGFVAGINFAVNHGARIINISASGASDSAALDDALGNAEAHGVVVVASSGNDSNEQTPYPAAIPTVLAVSATDQADKLASFSSYGPYVDLAAPGVDVTSTWWAAATGNGYMTASGSSASAPLVSGTAAIVAGLNPNASAARLREILTDSAHDVASPGIDAQTGFGLVDAYASALIASPPSDAGPASISRSASGTTSDLYLSGTGFTPGEPLTIWTSSSDGYHVNRSLTAGKAGNFTADLGRTWTFPEGTVSAFAVGDESDHAVDAKYDVTASPAADPFKPVGAVPTTADRTYFPATGHTLAYGFKQFWESHGGLTIFGYPISEEFSEKNPDTGQQYTVQYFERYRFEYHPEFAGTPQEVSLGRLGVQTAPQTFPVAPPPASSDILYFAATQHTLSGQFRSFWEHHGGLEVFGYPTSEPFEEGGVLVQYFERTRFELHPELPPGSQVLLSRLGVKLARQEGYLR